VTLPIKAVDRIFLRLSATYGRAFTAMWEGIDTNDVKPAWAHPVVVMSGGAT
jgi:hypothetical protein